MVATTRDVVAPEVREPGGDMELRTRNIAERVTGLQKTVSEAELVRFRVSIDGSFAQVRTASGNPGVDYYAIYCYICSLRAHPYLNSFRRRKTAIGNTLVEKLFSSRSRFRGSMRTSSSLWRKRSTAQSPSNINYLGKTWILMR